MVNRENYKLVCAYLSYVRTILPAKPVSAHRYWFYLRHFLIWLDETGLSNACVRTPSFADYIALLQTTRHLSPHTIAKVMQISQRF